VDLGAAGGAGSAGDELAVVVGVADTARAVALVEADGEHGFIGDEDAHDVAHALAVLALTRAAGGDEVVTVLVVHDRAEAGVVAATGW
jgi:hypothetical protein